MNNPYTEEEKAKRLSNTKNQSKVIRRHISRLQERIDKEIAEKLDMLRNNSIIDTEVCFHTNETAPDE